MLVWFSNLWMFFPFVQFSPILLICVSFLHIKMMLNVLHSSSQHCPFFLMTTTLSKKTNENSGKLFPYIFKDMNVFLRGASFLSDLFDSNGLGRCEIAQNIRKFIFLGRVFFLKKSFPLYFFFSRETSTLWRRRSKGRGKFERQTHI